MIKHNMSYTREYKSWEAMKSRCLNPNMPNYLRYEGRGIKICPTWIHSFEQFFADMGPRPLGFSLDHKDSNADYSPDNCRWASAKTQASNKRNNKYYNGKLLKEWAEIYSIPKTTIYERINRCGWSFEEAIGIIPRTKKK